MIISSKSSKIKIKSMIGEVDFYRYWVHCRYCGEGYAPFDEAIEVNEGHKITKNLTVTMCEFGQNSESYEEACKIIEKYVGVGISAATMMNVCETVGNKLFEKECQESEYLYENQHKSMEEVADRDKKGRLYIQVDGSFVAIRHKGWKEVKLGEVFKDSKVINAGKERHIIVEKDYTALLGSAEDFKKLLWNCAIRNGLNEVKEVVIIGDGAKWVWNIAQELFPDAVFILDYYHFSEHIHECANIIYMEDEKNKKEWIDNIIDGFMDDKVEITLQSIKPEKYKDEKAYNKVIELKTYLENNKDKLNYKSYKNKGYFIGSGAIESGNKCVIQRRLKQPGMRWNEYGAQGMASLRAAYKSDNWNRVIDIVFDKAS